MHMGDAESAVVALDEAGDADPFLAAAHWMLVRLLADARPDLATARCGRAVAAMRGAPHIAYGALGYAPAVDLSLYDVHYGLASCLSSSASHAAVLEALMAAQCAASSRAHHEQLTRALCAPSGTRLRGGVLEPAWMPLGLFRPRPSGLSLVLSSATGGGDALAGWGADRLLRTSSNGSRSQHSAEASAASVHLRTSSTASSTCSALGQRVVKLKPAGEGETRLLLVHEGDGVGRLYEHARRKLRCSDVILMHPSSDSLPTVVCDDDDAAGASVLLYSVTSR
jgi:hypothetical protein